MKNKMTIDEYEHEFKTILISRGLDDGEVYAEFEDLFETNPSFLEEQDPEKEAELVLKNYPHTESNI